MVAQRDKEVAAMDNSVEEHNNNQVRAESLKAEIYQQNQEIASLTKELKLIKSIVEDLKVQANTMSSEKNIAVSKLQQLQGGVNAFTSELSTRIKTEEAEEKIQQLKSVISENIRILDNKFPENVEILREYYELEGKLKHVREET